MRHNDAVNILCELLPDAGDKQVQMRTIHILTQGCIRSFRLKVRDGCSFFLLLGLVHCQQSIWHLCISGDKVLLYRRTNRAACEDNCDIHKTTPFHFPLVLT